MQALAYGIKPITVARQRPDFTDFIAPGLYKLLTIVVYFTAKSTAFWKYFFKKTNNFENRSSIMNQLCSILIFLCFKAFKY
jgi:hypothetical protein